MHQQKSKGFSLIEIILATFIMSVVAGFGLFSLSQGRQSAQSRGMAEEIAEEFKAARQQAISQQKPVAIVFPSSDRGTGLSQSFYQLEGVSRPLVKRSMSYAGNYPESCFFWGSWGGGEPESTDLSDSEFEFDLATWVPLPNPTDYVVVFSPSGTVKSNGLPIFAGGEYRLLVSNGVQETGQAPLFTPAAVSKPYTVRIGKTGAVTVSPGVHGANIPELPAIALGTPANSLPAPSAVLEGPRILEIRAEPKPLELSDGGALTVVPQEGYITLIAEAEDPSGGPLTVRWQADGPSGSGTFSSEKPMSMTWDPKFVDASTGRAAPRWTARMNWCPPENAVSGELYTLTCFVENPRGGDDQEQLGTNASVEVVRPHKVACINTDDAWRNYYVAWLNPEGTNVISVTVPDLVFEQLTPVWAPNGSKLAFYSGKDAPDGAFEAKLYLVNDDGTGLRTVFNCRGDITDYNFGPSFAPDGSQVCFSAFQNDSDNSASRVWRCNVYGSPSKRQLTFETAPPGIVTEHTDVAWNPVYPRWILYTGTRYDMGTGEHVGSSIRVCDVPIENSRDLVLETGSDWANTIGESHWSFDGRKIVYTQGGRLKTLRFDHTTGMPIGAPIDITPSIAGFQASMPRFSPDDNQVAVVNWTNGALHVLENWNSSTPNHKVTDIDGGIYGYNWSADGTEFVFSVLENEHIFTVSADGGEPKDVTPPGFNVWSTPSWWAP